MGEARDHNGFRGRIEDHIDAHPGATTPEIAAALGCDPDRLRVELWKLAQHGRVAITRDGPVQSNGVPVNRHWPAAPPVPEPADPSASAIRSACRDILANRTDEDWRRAGGRPAGWVAPVVRLSVGRI